MATHSNILAWEIPCSEELGKLQSGWSQKSRTCLMSKQQTTGASTRGGVLIAIKHL